MFWDVLECFGGDLKVFYGEFWYVLGHFVTFWTFFHVLGCFETFWDVF